MIGIWRNKDEFAKLLKDAGWEVRFSSMPTGFYSEHYRYDALLYRPAKLTSLWVTPGCENSVAELAVLGAESLSNAPKSTSNLVRPDLQNFLNYSKVFLSSDNIPMVARSSGCSRGVWRVFTKRSSASPSVMDSGESFLR
jgi:hypothetical protein